MRTTPGAWVDKNLGWLLIAAAFMVGGFLIAAAIHVEDKHSFPHHVLRDLGIAFIVAAVVTMAFEIHIRARYQVDTIHKVFDTTMGALWNRDVWEQVRKQIFDRKIIREEFDIHLTFLQGHQSQKDRILIQVRHSYYALSLLRKRESIQIKSTLDNHVCDKPNKLPRFSCLRIGQRTFDLEKIDLQNIPPEYPFKIDTASGILLTELHDLLPEKEGKHVRVELARQELVYIPGTYVLVMAELTKVANVHLLNLPSDIEAAIYVPTQDDAKPIELFDDQPLALSQIYRDLLLLPGQTIEFRFKRT